MPVSSQNIEVIKPRRNYSVPSEDELIRSLKSIFKGNSVYEETVMIDSVEVEIYVLEDSDIRCIEKVGSGILDYPNKKSRLAIYFEEIKPKTIRAGEVEFTNEELKKPNMAKNKFIEEMTGVTPELLRSR